jgi:hypothetical protein
MKMKGDGYSCQKYLTHTKLKEKERKKKNMMIMIMKCCCMMCDAEKASAVKS